jgi:uncharacterized protein (TIGR02284 family)
METSNEKIAEVLNGVVQVNNDRIACYEHALKELKEENQDLKPLFFNMIDESRRAKIELGTEIENLKGSIENGTTTGGKIHRGWMDVKALFTGHTRYAILEDCEYVEDSTQSAYHQAIEEKSLPSYLLELISVQKETLKASHNEIKAFRDQEVRA